MVTNLRDELVDMYCGAVGDPGPVVPLLGVSNPVVEVETVSVLVGGITEAQGPEQRINFHRNTKFENKSIPYWVALFSSQNCVRLTLEIFPPRNSHAWPVTVTEVELVLVSTPPAYTTTCEIL